MDQDTDLLPSSPTNSSVSSSDLDTESTGSFFRDRSTSLGTLMGVTFPDFTLGPVRVPSGREQHRGVSGDGGGHIGQKQRVVASAEGRRRRRGRGKRWWRLCREEDMVPSTSLGDFLQVERRAGGWGVDLTAQDHFFYGGAPAGHEELGGAPLFQDGRLLPPPHQHQQQKETVAGSLGRLPVLLTGICSGGDG